MDSLLDLPDSFDIDTNRFNFGDPRPILHNFLLEEFPTVFASPFWGPLDKFENKDVITFVCSERGHVRVAWPTRKSTKASMIELLKYNDGYNPLIIIPAVIIGQNRCVPLAEDGSGNRTLDRHVVLFMYNHITKELERIDIKKFALSGFKMQSMDKKVPALINKEQRELYYIRDFEIPHHLFEREGALYHLCQKKPHIYPPILLMYLKLRAMHYKEPRELVMKRLVNAIDGQPNHLWTLWKRYVAYHNRTNPSMACHFGVRIRNPANNKCVNVDNKNYLLYHPEKTCPLNKVKNPLTGRCIQASKAVHVNFIPRIAKTHLAYNEKQVSIGNPSTSAYAALATIGKFKHAFLTYPRHMHIEDMGRNAFKIMWNAETKKISMSRSIRQQWREQMANENENDKHRFIITFASLGAGQKAGRHANSIIYDKKTRELELFDPMGRELSPKFNSHVFYKKLLVSFKSGNNPILPKDAKLVITQDYYPLDNLFQSREVEEVSDYEGGSCALWRLYWILLRMSNPDIDRKSLIYASMRYIRDQESFTGFIRKFNKYVINIVNRKFPDRPVVNKTK